jgi:predicted  nucleic acid-binding Zn-ribbon protein
MSDLHESIQSLAHMAGLIPEHVGHLAQELTTAHTAADEFIAKVQDKQTQATIIFSHIQSAFHEFEQDLAQHHTQLEQEFNEVDHDVETLEKFITESKDHAHQEIETTRQKLGTWKTQLEAHHSVTETSRGVAQGTIADLHTKIQNEKSHLETTMGATHREIDELLHQQLNAVKTATGDHITHMVQEMEQNNKGVIDKVQDLLHHFETSGNDLSHHLTGTSHSVIHAESDQLLHEFQHQVVDVLQHQVDTALHQVVDVLDHMHDVMGGDSGHLSIARTELEKPIHEAEHTVELVKKAIRDVVHFAEKFGIHLGIHI